MIRSIVIFTLAFSVWSCAGNKGEPNGEIIIPDDLEQVGHLLDSIYEVDQGSRIKLQELSEEYGFQSKEVQSIIPAMVKTDSSNLAVVTKILDKHGWLGKDEVGSTANQTLFLVIQHADHETQEKYLPMMREAVKNKKASKSDLALLEDRTALGRGELQIYGSQIGMDPQTGEMYVMPLKDPETVNERRQEMNLGTIENYISHWDLTWDVEAYKADLPRLIEMHKKQLELEKEFEKKY